VLTALAGLAPGTTYHYRLVASSLAGTSYGPDETLTTGGAARTTTFTPFAVATVPSIAATAVALPTEAAAGKSSASTPSTSRLQRALQQCKRDKARRRAPWEKLARKRYGPKPKKKNKRQG
jgi:hypothetical protein